MKKENYFNVATSIGDLALSCKGLPPVCTPAHAIAKMIYDKVNNTSNLIKDILINNKRSFTDLNDNEKEIFNEECYLIYQYTIQGKARDNLKLLIKYLKGQINKEELYIDEFYKHMDILANLTSDEIEFISNFNDGDIIFNARKNTETISNNKKIAIAHSLQGKGLLIIKTNQGTFWDDNGNSPTELSCFKTKIIDEILNYTSLDISNDK